MARRNRRSRRDGAAPRAAVLGLLAPLAVGNLSSPVEAAGWGVLQILSLQASVRPQAGDPHLAAFAVLVWVATKMLPQ